MAFKIINNVLLSILLFMATFSALLFIVYFENDINEYYPILLIPVFLSIFVFYALKAKRNG